MKSSHRTAPVSPGVPAPESLWTWFHPANWCAAGSTFLVVLATYVRTLQPTVGLEDSGELITGAYRLGVPHPPGYPTLALLGKLFTFLPVGDVAYRVNLMSAVCGALAAAMVTLVLAKTADLFSPDDQAQAGRLPFRRIINSLCAIAPGMLFAFTPGTWSQSTIAEAYALNVLHMAVLVVLSLVLMFHPHRRGVLCWIAFVFALGLVNHQTIVVMAASLAWLVYATSPTRRHFVMLAVNAAVLLAFTLCMFHSKAVIQAVVSLPAAKELRELPFNGWPLWNNFFVMFIGPFLVYLAVARVVNKAVCGTTEWVTLAASFFAGLGVYFYLPIASATNPQMNWARARTVEGFWHSVLRTQYEQPAFSRPVRYFLSQMGLYLRDTWDQYPIVLVFAAIGLLTLAVVWRDRRARAWIVYVIITVAACGTGMVFLMNPKLDITSQYINRVFFILGHAGLGMLVGYGMLMTVSVLPVLARTHAQWSLWARGVSAGVALCGTLFVAAGAVLALHGAGTVPPWLALGQTTMGISLPPGRAWWFLLVFGTVCAAVGVLVLYAMRTAGQRRWASLAAACLLMATPLIPIIENWDEMNLRTKYFGFIFGVEMLKVCEPGSVFFGGTDPGRFVPEYLIGCNQFRGDIWLITQNGLADVTYMNVLRDRYCRVRTIWPWARTLLHWLGAEREDPLRVDNRSTDPKRGTIYIPSPQDFEHAFQLFLADYEARKRRGEPVPGGVTVVDGKVSVSGVEAVMQINAILARMIWENNTNAHEFYVEESYVMPWMYPYLKPAGLIMKLCKEPVAITQEVVAADTAYWTSLTNTFDRGGVIDYTDSVSGKKSSVMVRPGDFAHDEPAQKAFSKARAALAGVYESRGMWAQAQDAYRQALWLYPRSGEAYMRLASMYLRLNRCDDALALAKDYKTKDPRNGTIDGFIACIEEARKQVALREGRKNI